MCFAFVLCVRMVAREQWKLVHKTELVTKTKRKRGRAAKTWTFWYEYHVKARAEEKPLLKYFGCGHTVYTDLEFRKTCWKRLGSGASACTRERRLKLNVPSTEVEIVIARASACRKRNTTQEKQMRPPSETAAKGLRTYLWPSRKGRKRSAQTQVCRRCGSFATPLPLGWTRGRVCGFISRAVTRSVMRGNRADLRVALPLAAGWGARPVATRVFAWCCLNSMKLSWKELTTPHPRNRKSWFWQVDHTNKKPQWTLAAHLKVVKHTTNEK